VGRAGEVVQHGRRARQLRRRPRLDLLARRTRADRSGRGALRPGRYRPGTVPGPTPGVGGRILPGAVPGAAEPGPRSEGVDRRGGGAPDRAGELRGGLLPENDLLLAQQAADQARLRRLGAVARFNQAQLQLLAESGVATVDTLTGGAAPK
jgi:hypothetical protein